LADVSAEVDHWYDWLVEEENNNGRAGPKGKSDESSTTGAEGSSSNQNGDSEEEEYIDYRQTQLWELAKLEGDEKWIEWLQTHIWTYVGLSAPMLGALNPLRAVISGENMGLPLNDDIAREMELTFGSTHTLNPVSTNNGFCDEREVDDWGEDPSEPDKHESTLACLDDIATDIEYSAGDRDPWKHFPLLKALLRDRVDWTTGKPMIDIEISHCNTTNRNSCEITGDRIKIGPKDVQEASIFQTFTDLWKEDGKPLIVKKEQLEDSFLNSNVRNILNHTWDRPLIKHVIMAYGVDIPTEVGYIYSKKYNVEYSEDGVLTSIIDRNETELPHLKTAFWENPRGALTKELIDAPRASIGEYFMKKKPKKEPMEVTVPEARLQHSGDGSVPYLSLSWVQTWLLHATRARRFTEDKYKIGGGTKNALDHITVSHRPQGESDWIEGPAPESLAILGGDDQKADSDTGISHPHGTRYKPLMKRYHNIGVSRKTGIEYTTSIIEAVGIEHKETTRNFDILAAVFTEVLDYMHDDLGLIPDDANDSDTPDSDTSDE